MMAGLFLVFLICMILIYKEQRNIAFGLVIINLILCLLVLLHHSTDIVKIRL